MLHQRRKTASTQIRYNNNYAGLSCSSDTPFKRCHHGLTLPSATARTRRLTAHGHLLLGCPCRWSSRLFRLKLENALQAFDLRLQYRYSKEDHLLYSLDSLFHWLRCLFIRCRSCCQRITLLVRLTPPRRTPGTILAPVTMVRSVASLLPGCGSPCGPLLELRLVCCSSLTLVSGALKGQLPPW